MKNLTIAILLAATFLTGCKKSPDPVVEIESEDTTTIFPDALTGWEIVKSDLDINTVAKDFFFISEQVGFVVGNTGDMFKTIDSGSSWQKQDPATSLDLYSVFYINENIGYLGARSASCDSEDCGKGALFLKTTDGGKSWSKTFLKEYVGIHSITFSNELNGLAIGVSDGEIPHLIRTQDGGETWIELDLAINASVIDLRINLIDRVIYVKGQRQLIFKSTDFGNSWTPLNIPDIFSLYGLQFLDKNTGFASALSGLYKTTDGGASWQKTDFQPIKNFTTFHFLDANEGFAIESVEEYSSAPPTITATFKGTIILHTLDGGKTWTKSPLYKSLKPGSFTFPSDNRGFSLNGLHQYRFKRK